MRVENRQPLLALIPRFCLVLGLVFSAYSFAGPLIEVGDVQSRHHLVYLRDSGAIDLPLNTWPLPWADVAREIQDIEFDELTDTQLWSLRFLKHALNQAQRGRTSAKILYGGSSIVPFTNFGSSAREQASLRSKSNFTGENLSLNIDVKTVYEPIDGDDYQFDGSYLAATLGNWILGAGGLERWWGPGWQSSLILSNSARSGFGVFARRKEALGFTSPALAWIGPWTIDTFGERLNNDDERGKRDFFGARLSFAPLSFIELGASQTLLVGRDPEPSPLLGDVELARPELPSNQAIKEGERQRQISYDARVNFTAQLAVYGQVLRASEDNSQASPRSTLMGIESAFLMFGTHNRLIVEISDPKPSATTSSATGNRDNDGNEETRAFDFDKAYRFKLRSLGESAGYLDRKVSVSGEHFFSNGHQLSWRYLETRSNATESSENAGDQRLAELIYKAPLSPSLRASAGVFTLKEKMTLGAQEIESGAHIQLEFRY